MLQNVMIFKGARLCAKFSVQFLDTSVLFVNEGLRQRMEFRPKFCQWRIKYSIPFSTCTIVRIFNNDRAVVTRYD